MGSAEGKNNAHSDPSQTVSQDRKRHVMTIWAIIRKLDMDFDLMRDFDAQNKVIHRIYPREKEQR